MNDLDPDYDSSFERLLRPAIRISMKQRKNIPDDVPSPTPYSSTDEDIFTPKKKVKR